MKPIEALFRFLQETFPEARADLTAPVKPNGVWSLDIDYDAIHIAVEWSEAGGFFISTTGFDSFGERPDERYDSLPQIKSRLRKLLAKGVKTTPPIGVFLSRLREQRGLTQKELADALGVKQSSISGFEKRTDLQMSTFWKIIDALGASAEIKVSCSEATYSMRAGSMELDRQFLACNWTEYAEAFSSLKNAGEFQRGSDLAEEVRTNHAVIEFLF